MRTQVLFVNTYNLIGSHQASLTSDLSDLLRCADERLVQRQVGRVDERDRQLAALLVELKLQRELRVAKSRTASAPVFARDRNG